MELENFTAALSDCLGGGEMVLSTETRAALQSSIVLLKARERFASVKLWGRIKGVHRDYYIAQGFGKDELKEKKGFYSVDNCVSFLELPKLHPVTAASAQRITTRFTGTATHEYTVKEPGPSESDPPLDLPPDVEASRITDDNDGSPTVTSTIKEDQRLAAVVAAIDYECASVPRGAFMRDGANNVKPVSTFRGLSLADSGKMQCYVHFREPTKERSLSDRAQQDKILDFLDPIADDVPEGSWYLQYTRGGAIALVKNTIWPGYTGYHVPGTNTFGYVYNGLGQRNQDLAFMLPNPTDQE
eukprot:m.54142 g.54142  ORF g.54142 m.54142 type:complete len:300 (+) comp10905_c0_seq2:128-1027(+)